MITTATLEALVIGHLKIDAADKARFLVTENLNAAQRHLLVICPASMISVAVRTCKGDLQIGVRRYQWPMQLIRILRMWLSYSEPITDTFAGREAREVRDVSSIASGNEQGTVIYPVYGIDVEGGFEIAPLPAADQADGWRIRYVQPLMDMSAEQNCLLPAQFTNLLVFYAAMLSAAVETYDMTLSGAMETRFEKELERFIPKKEKQ